MATEETLNEPINAEWYYVGHYGQLGPLTLEQMSELAQDGVIDADTYVWRPSMPDWLKANMVPDLLAHVHPTMSDPMSFGGVPVPPPSPGPGRVSSAFNAPPQGAPNFVSPTPQPQPFMGQGFGNVQGAPQAMQPFGGYGLYYRNQGIPKSDKNRIVAGVLNLIFPGIGRLYLGYYAHGALQLILFPCGIGHIWSIFDGIMILVGAVKFDGFGRQLD